ncbi:TMhelix containing protein [Vibrio phage 1.039.O._10N.286.55.A2]|nr:TMhelix containing protein [Vibrio phage 1.039.O._10N.286.55.A2]AUR84642.1 TMhelix containing protein [Vibrio phage 1.061.O._10N.286.55.C2]
MRTYPMDFTGIWLFVLIGIVIGFLFGFMVFA